ncbi:hypothetical protein [Acinetobacter pittii]|uniref:hypothetical protein n=1 Tax=Acinetobacter pittii TaxID=48296 RepID=UPI001F43C7F0|nr:hypothetical protein [Acinetobacter pittii]MCF1279778.1 hypothetical protein [Acinetobacter pittii]
MDKNALQAQFEDIAIQNGWNINKYPAGWDSHSDDEYVDELVNGAWWIFQHQQAKVEQLKGQLIKLGFTDNGGLLMKPPLGIAPRFDLLDELKSSIENLVQKYKHDAHASSLFGDQDKAQMYSHFANQLDQLLKG